MKCLVINTLVESDKQSEAAILSLSEIQEEVEVIQTEKMKISSCIGCTNCWLKTPGVCAIKDDHESLFKKFLKSDSVIFIAESKLGFVSHKMKNIVDRFIPLGTPLTEICNGEARHESRYHKHWNIGLLYTGKGDKEYLTEWMARFALNFHSRSLGAYGIEESEVLFHELSDI